MEKQKRILVILPFIAILAVSCGSKESPKPKDPETTSRPVTTKKVLLVNSYHKGYPWSDALEAGARGVFDKHPEIEVKFQRMDTKRNADEEFKKKAGLAARELVESWKPDLMIVSDDNASKYVVVPYFKNVDLPVVFCGVNWDAGIYGYPFDNATGMVEVALINDLLKNMRPYAKGDRVGFLAAEMTSTRQDLNFFKNIAGVKFEKEVFVSTYADWKAAYIKLQGEVDMLIVPPLQGVSGWDEADAKRFVLENAKIPSGEHTDFMANFTLMCFAKDASEHGEWAAQKAVEILNGKKPGEIPIATNTRAKIFLNMRMAKRLGIKFPPELIRNAHFVEQP